MDKKSVFETLSSIKIDPKNIKNKGKYTYISWAAAWQDVCNEYPDATFSKRLSEVNGFVEVDVTIEGKTLTEQFPILNFNNKPIANPNSFEINTAFQRGLVKCLAFFGYGLFIYKGEDLPIDEEEGEEVLREEDIVWATPKGKDDDVSYNDIKTLSVLDGFKTEIEKLDQEGFDKGKDDLYKRMADLSRDDKSELWVIIEQKFQT